MMHFSNDTVTIRDCNKHHPSYHGSETFTKYGRFLLTEGIVDIAQETESNWFLDIIISHQDSLKGESYQSWRLERVMTCEDEEVQERTNTFKVICDNGNDQVLKTQKVPFSDFSYDTYKVLLIDETILLPSEY